MSNGTCRLQQSHPFALDGLTFDGHFPRLDPQYFECCQATGLCFGAPGKAASSCSLKKNYGLLCNLSQSFAKINDFNAKLEAFMRSLSADDWAAARRFCQGISAQRELQTSQGIEQKKVAWLSWLILAWRQGWQICCADLSQTDEIHRWFDQHMHQQQPQLLVIHHCDRLWEADRNQAFSGLVDLAEKSQWRLWIHTENSSKPDSSPAPPRPRSRTAFEDRLQSIKKRSVLSYADPSSISKLKSWRGFEASEWGMRSS